MTPADSASRFVIGQSVGGSARKLLVWLVILNLMPSASQRPALASVPPSSLASRAARVRLRRALTLMLMTVVAPGTAQIAAGNRRVGRYALRAFAVALAFAFALVITLLVSRDMVIQLFTNVWFLGLLRFGLILYAVAWAYLLIDAWRIAGPLGLLQKHRLAMTALNGVLCLSLCGVLLYASQLVAVQRNFIQTVFTQTQVSGPEHGRYNVLLLGGDAGRGRVGLRPDSMTVASIDQQTGRTVLFGLPRNMEDVPFPPGSAMARQFPNGFNCADACYLNAVNTWATGHPGLFPGVKDPGVYATTQAIEQITGLHINYYVLVDMSGFEKLVNALGGIRLNVHQEVPIGSVGTTPSAVIPTGNQVLNGYQALWYARSRAWSDDYARMARQKCVLNAMAHQLNPETVLTKFGAIASATQSTLKTSIPASEIHTFVDLALKARHLPITTVSFVPPKISTTHPDWTLIRQMVKTAIARSIAAGTSKTAHATKPSAALGNKDAFLPGGYAANDTANLSGSC